MDAIDGFNDIDDTTPNALDPELSQGGLNGGDGTDLIFADPGNDAFAGGGDDLIFADPENDTIAGGGDDLIFADPGNDTIAGGGDDPIFADPGNDTIAGGGDDPIFANPGNDTIAGDVDTDTFSFTGEFGDDEIDINLTDAMNATASQSSDFVYRGQPLTANLALDGDPSTFNHQSLTDTTPSMTIDLGEDAFIESVYLLNQSAVPNLMDRIEGAMLTVLDDGVAVGSTHVLAGGLEQTIDVGGIVGDAIRIDHVAAPGDPYAVIHFAEIDIYGHLIA